MWASWEGLSFKVDCFELLKIVIDICQVRLWAHSKVSSQGTVKHAKEQQVLHIQPHCILLDELKLAAE